MENENWKEGLIYLTMEHCEALEVEYFGTHSFYLRIEELISLRSSWDKHHTGMFESIISHCGIRSELSLERVNGDQPPGWYSISSVSGYKNSITGDRLMKVSTGTVIIGVDND